MTEVWWMLATNFDVPGREPARTEGGYHFYDIISTIQIGCFEPHCDNVWAKKQMRPLAQRKSENGNFYGK